MISLKKTPIQFAEQCGTKGTDHGTEAENLDFLFQVWYDIIVASDKETHHAYD